MEIIIEEISRGHKLLNRYKLDKNSVMIGRGYQNDIILSDPHVCPDHLQLNFDGEHWLIEDQNSINGSYVDDDKTPIKQHIVNSGDIINLGKSQIRIVFANHPVAQTLHLNSIDNIINFMRHPIVIALSLLCFTTIIGYLFYLNKATEINITQLLAPAIGLSFLFALWPIGVALISHFTKHDTRIMTQVGVSFLFYNILWLSDSLDTIVDFNVSTYWPLLTLTSLIPLILIFCLFWLNAYIGFHMTTTRRLVIAASLTLLFFGGNYLTQLSKKPEFSVRPSYNATLLKPSFLLVQSSTVDRFIEDSEKLFAQVQEDLEE